MTYVARLTIIGKGKGKTLVGTITVHCEPIDYKLLVSKTLIDAGRNARSCLIEAKEDLMGPAAKQSNISASLGSSLSMASPMNVGNLKRRLREFRRRAPKNVPRNSVKSKLLEAIRDD